MGNAHITNLYPTPNKTSADAPDEALAVDDTAGGVQFATLHEHTKYVMIDVQIANVRVTFDGSAPTATNGHILVASQGLLVLSASAARKAKFIEDTATDAVVHMSQFID
jgi:hypothetical protein|tara:strand:+ start:257 stop:583 length:327 start_codon:yes stop_codon:yes gene_type:complete